MAPLATLPHRHVAMTAHDVSEHVDDQYAKQVPGLQHYADAGGSASFASEQVEATVPIQAPSVGDTEAVDIRVDGDEVAESSQQQQQQQHVLDNDHAQAGNVPSIWMTPARSVHSIVPGAQGWQVVFAATGPSDVAGAAASSATAVAAEPSSQSPTSFSRTDVQQQLVQPAHPPLSEADLISALPHLTAIFHPGLMQWQVILPEEELSKCYHIPEKLSQIEAESAEPAPLWRYETNVIALPHSEEGQILSVPQLQPGTSASAWEPISRFDRWRSTRGRSIYSSMAGHLHSVVPAQLLDGFQAERMGNPRPGSSGAVQFQEAATTLIRIVGNAANGEGRALTATGRTISTKLGMDRHAEGIFTALGFQRDERVEAQGTIKTIKPPDMASKVWQLRMRRAWIELVLWFDYHRSMSTAAGSADSDVRSNVPFYPRKQACDGYLAHLFEFQPSQEILPLKRSATPDIAVALESIGTDEGPTDELLEYCYRLNSADASAADKVAQFTALTVAVEGQRKDSDMLQTVIAVERSKGLFAITELTQAYLRLIGVEMDSLETMEQVDETFIIEVYTNAVKEAASEPAKVQQLKEAIQLISLSRGRPPALEAALDMRIEMGLDKAYEILEVQQDTDDDFIAAAYQLAATESRFAPEQCTEALRIIAMHRKSATLQKLHRSATGSQESDAWEVADADRPAGLNNIGNTCYLNSVLQYFYAIRPLRERVLEAGRDAGTKGHIDASRLRVGGRKVTQREIDRSHKFVTLLAQLYSAMMTSPLSAVTPERELAYLALVSSRVEESSEEMVGVLTSEEPAQIDTKAEEGPQQGGDTDGKLVDEPLSISQTDTKAGDPLPETASAKDETAAPSSTENATEALQDSIAPAAAMATPVRPELDIGEAGQRRNSLMQLGAQQDVSECLDNVMFQVEAALTAQTVEDRVLNDPKLSDAADEEWVAEGDLLRRLFLGRTTQRLELEGGRLDGHGPSVHTKREIFKILPIDVLEEGRDIYDGLDGFFDEEILTDTGGQPMRRTVTLTDAPAVMQIQLQRVQFDRVRGAFKSQAHLSMGETLFMDRYMDFDPTVSEDQARLEKRKKGREARQRIAELRHRIRQLEPDALHSASRSLDRTGSFLSSLQKVRSPLDAAPAIDGTVDGISELGGHIPAELLDESLNTFLQEEAKRVEQELRDAEAEVARLKANVESLWEEEQRLEYVLASVFMHRGEASHGHYFLNQRKLGPDGKGQDTPSTWFKYNDNVVQDIPLGQVLKDMTGATPYLLSYVRKDMQDQICLFDTVCRQIESGLPVDSDAAATALPQDGGDEAAKSNADVNMLDGTTVTSLPAAAATRTSTGEDAMDVST